MIEQNTRKGILLMVATTIVFASQDGFSRHLAQEYNVMMVVMIRYWFFAAFVMAISARKVGGLRGVAATKQPFLQAFRGVLLAAEICVAILSFTLLGLVESHAIFACYPLLIAALSGPILGEKVGWRRWAAIGTGFVGILIILNPGVTVFAVEALIPLASALMFAVYGLLTRYVSREDSAATSFFWTGTTGAIFMTLVGIWFIEPMAPVDWIWMAGLCVLGALGHYLLIRCYEVAEASAVQPFAYLQLPFASVIGIFVFGDVLRENVAIGAALVVAAGLFTLSRARAKANQEQINAVSAVPTDADAEAPRSDAPRKSAKTP
ncbi:DMT family transporter [Rhodobacteraceae bacterium XHP0102]|nr:DMT family transporter [Rhodobacteraceae bacterium XHP0102]